MKPTTQTIKVLHCRSSAGRHGPERAFLEIAPALVALGVDSEVVALYRANQGAPAAHPWLDEVVAAGITASQIQDPSAFSPRVVRRLAWTMRRASADLLHTHDYKSNILGGLMARQADRSLPWVATVHLHSRATRRLKVYRALDLFLLRLADRVVTVSRDQRRLLLQRGVDRRRIVLVPNVIDAPGFAAGAAPSAETRSGLGLREDALVVTVAGRLTSQKGVDVLIAAIPELVAAAPEAVVIVAGAGADEAALAAHVAERGLQACVRFIGYRKDVASLFAASDIVAIPSRSEGLPIVLLEAMSMGRAVVATRVGGVPDVLDSPATGWLVAPDDPVALAGALVEAALNPERRRQVGEAGHQRVLAACAPERAARRLASVYRTVLAERA